MAWEDQYEEYKGTTLQNATLEGAIFQQLVPMNTMVFPSNGTPAVKLNFANDPPTVWVNPDLAWDVAAKQFWNAVYRCVGRPALFPESDM